MSSAVRSGVVTRMPSIRQMSSSSMLSAQTRTPRLRDRSQAALALITGEIAVCLST
jgi:hypothetical protein